MTYKQVTSPRTTVNDGAGWCLRHTQSVYAAPVAHRSAWAAWLAQTGRSTGAHPKNVSVPVWFSHWGTYGAPPSYENWGHVVAYVPGRGYLSSPLNGFGRQWFSTIAAVERAFGAKYVGWSTHMNGKKIVEKVKSTPTPNPRKDKPVRSFNTSYQPTASDATTINKGKRRYLRTNKNGLAVREKTGGRKLRSGPTLLTSYVTLVAGPNGLTARIGAVRGVYNAKAPSFTPKTGMRNITETLAPGESRKVNFTTITNHTNKQDIRLYVEGLEGSGRYSFAQSSGFQW